MRGGARRLRELDVEVLVEGVGHLVVAGQREAAHELVVGVRALPVLRQARHAPHHRLEGGGRSGTVSLKTLGTRLRETADPC